MNELTKEEMDILVRAVNVLHSRAGGTEWNISVGKSVFFDPDDFRPFRPIVVNGTQVGQFNVDVSA